MRGDLEMPDSIRAISAISGIAHTRDPINAHMNRLLNDGGLRRQYQPKKKITRIKYAGEHRDEFEHPDHEAHQIDILA